MNFTHYLTAQFRAHPSMQVRDVIKLCYQASRGAEHLLSDPDAARRYLEEEYAAVSPTGEVLFEPISEEICRVHLGAWKARDLPLSWLFAIFAASCRAADNAAERLSACLRTAGEVIACGEVPISSAEWESALRAYEKDGMPAVHHSEEYRRLERPAYRIVHSRFCRILPILERVHAHPAGDAPCIIAVDGRAASGKSTLAACLQTVLDADLIHMDDFFVPPALRSADRFRTPGENIHHERFAEEVLPHLRERRPFSYRIFDCGRMDYHGARQIGVKPYRVVEGSYSCHPKFGAYADITVFSDVSEEEQTERIRARNGEEMLRMFQGRWIPMEEAYFDRFGIRERADILLR